MSEPIDYLIVQNLQAALQTIAVSGGYYYTLAALVVKLDPDQDVDRFKKPDGPRPFLILELKPEVWAYQPANRVHLVWPLAIHWVGTSDPTEDASRLRTFLRGCADVERAIAKDPSRGGRAVDTRIVKRACDEPGEGAEVWAVIDIEIHLYRTFGAPDA